MHRSVGLPAGATVAVMDTVSVRDVAEAAFATDVIEASSTKPVVVDFWAPWCGPCRQLSPLLERVAARYADDIDVVKVNVDQAQRVAGTYRVQGIPAVKAFKDGAVVAEFVGLQPEAVVDRFFADLAPSAADRLVDQVAAAAPEEQEALLREALSLQADHPRGIVLLASLLRERGAVDEAIALLQRVPADAEARRLLAQLHLQAAGAADLDGLRAAAESGEASDRLSLGKALAAAGHLDQAMPHLMAAVADPSTREDARTAVLEVFAVADGSDLVRTWRPRLAAALF